MRHKELRIALVCYGGISLAVYMHGVTKELWKLARASRAFHAGEAQAGSSELIYAELLHSLSNQNGVRVRVLPDIITGASAGGINAVFLAQAIHSGQSLEPLTDLWLENADVDRLLDPAARQWTGVAKFWAPPIVEYLFSRPGNMVTDSVAPEMRRRVRRKLARFVRSRWFQPPFSGSGFSQLIADAFAAMASSHAGEPLLPGGHPLDLFVTATDFHGYLKTLHLNSPPVIQESEHRLSIGFRSRTPREGGHDLAHPMELTLAARSTASFPGAFPALRLAEIDQLAAERGLSWPRREDFLRRIMPDHMRSGEIDDVSLIDGSVLVNAPFSEALDALSGRPSVREVDRRFVYIDPSPDHRVSSTRVPREVGFFRAIFGSISTIPREQPIRDNLEMIENISRDAEQLRRIADSLRPEVERVVGEMFQRTFFLDKPTPKRLVEWRSKAQRAAEQQAGYTFHSYSQTKFAGIVALLARFVVTQAKDAGLTDVQAVAACLRRELHARGLASLVDPRGQASDASIAFFRSLDVRFRIRRLRLLARRISRDLEDDPSITDADRDAGREEIYRALALYLAREAGTDVQSGDEGDSFAQLAAQVLERPGDVLDALDARWDLAAVDLEAELILSSSLEAMPRPLRNKILLAYLGFPFYDVATLPLLRNEGLTEYDPVKVDRISPKDAVAIRDGSAVDTLRGVEFYHFGAFFSRAYRENDYLWGRLNGAERMIDLVCSTAGGDIPVDRCRDFKRRLFLAILDEEESRLTKDPGLIPALRAEVLARLGDGQAD